jgi:hypothetical protein
MKAAEDAPEAATAVAAAALPAQAAVMHASRPRLLPHCTALWQAGSLLSPQQQQQQEEQEEPQQPPAAARPTNTVRIVPQGPILDVGCLLEPTLVAAAAEALNSISLDDPGSACLMGNACSAVEIERLVQSVMLEESELAMDGAV